MLSVRGPRRCAITFASTSSPSTAGLPTLISSPWLNKSTRPSLTEEPGSAASRSTRMRSPGATRYCLPPLTMQADSELSGLGTASDCTKQRLLPICGEGLFVDNHASSDSNRLHDSQPGQRGDRGGAAVRDQRQRDAGDRQQADVHPDVLEHLDQDHREHAAGQQLAEAVRSHAGRAQNTNQESPEKCQEDEAAEQAELLGERRENEVGRSFRDEAELTLHPMQPAAAEHPSGSDRDPRLDQVVPRAQRVQVGVEEDLEPPLLVTT